MPLLFIVGFSDCTIASASVGASEEVVGGVSNSDCLSVVVGISECIDVEGEISDCMSVVVRISALDCMSIVVGVSDNISVEVVLVLDDELEGQYLTSAFAAKAGKIKNVEQG